MTSTTLVRGLCVGLGSVALASFALGAASCASGDSPAELPSPSPEAGKDSLPESTPPTDTKIDNTIIPESGGEAEAADSASEPAQEASLPETSTPEAEAGLSEDAAMPNPAILSLNLHCLKVSGTSFSSNEERFAAIAKTVQEQNIVAMALQEACVTPTQDAMALLQTALQTATGATWHKAWMSAHVAWQGTADEAEEGLGLLVRDSLTDIQQLEYWHQGSLRRVALGGVLPPALGGARLWSLHFEYQNPTVAAWQARETAAWTLAQADPSLNVLVAGDFNSKEGSVPHASLLQFGFRDWTDTLDPNRIDHILAHRGAALKLLEASTIFDGTNGPIVSDHHGVLVRVVPGAGESVVVTRLEASAGASSAHYAVRGNVAPLTWSEGWPAWRVQDGWKLVLTEISKDAPFEYKWLVDDTQWQTGGNLTGLGGQDLKSTPAF